MKLTFCRTCWTGYDASTLPSQCPHLDPELDYVIAGGVHVVNECRCQSCLGRIERRRDRSQP